MARACVECHGVDLRGVPVFNTPDLNIGAAYDLPRFERLLATGIAADGGTKGVMSIVARNRFSLLTSEEVKALHDYLVKRALSGL